MNQMSKTKTLIFTALCVALGLVLPMLFHAVPNAGSIFLPMHIPVLISGFVCGPIGGLACGILTPLLSSVLTGMPPLFILPSMLFELAAYGLVGGLMFRFVRTPLPVADIYLSLITAMLAGRVLAGVLKALIFNVGEYSMQAWLTSSFVTALPGIVIQILIIPLIVQALRIAGVIPPAAKAKSA